LIYFVLIPSKHQKRKSQRRIIEADWEVDSEGKDYLNLAMFHKALYQLADRWTLTLDPVEYVTFLEKLLDLITTRDHTTGERIWRIIPFEIDFSNFQYGRRDRDDDEQWSDSSSDGDGDDHTDTNGATNGEPTEDEEEHEGDAESKAEATVPATAAATDVVVSEGVASGEASTLTKLNPSDDQLGLMEDGFVPLNEEERRLRRETRAKTLGEWEAKMSVLQNKLNDTIENRGKISMERDPSDLSMMDSTLIGNGESHRYKPHRLSVNGLDQLGSVALTSASSDGSRYLTSGGTWSRSPRGSPKHSPRGSPSGTPRTRTPRGDGNDSKSSRRSPSTNDALGLPHREHKRSLSAGALRPITGNSAGTMDSRGQRSPKGGGSRSPRTPRSQSPGHSDAMIAIGSMAGALAEALAARMINGEQINGGRRGDNDGDVNDRDAEAALTAAVRRATEAGSRTAHRRAHSNTAAATHADGTTSESLAELDRIPGAALTSPITGAASSAATSTNGGTLKSSPNNSTYNLRSPAAGGMHHPKVGHRSDATVSRRTTSDGDHHLGAWSHDHENNPGHFKGSVKGSFTQAARFADRNKGPQEPSQTIHDAEVAASTGRRTTRRTTTTNGSINNNSNGVGVDDLSDDRSPERTKRQHRSPVLNPRRGSPDHSPPPPSSSTTATGTTNVVHGEPRSGATTESHPFSFALDSRDRHQQTHGGGGSHSRRGSSTFAQLQEERRRRAEEYRRHEMEKRTLLLEKISERERLRQARRRQVEGQRMVRRAGIALLAAMESGDEEAVTAASSLLVRLREDQDRVAMEASPPPPPLTITQSGPSYNAHRSTLGASNNHNNSGSTRALLPSSSVPSIPSKHQTPPRVGEGIGDGSSTWRFASTPDHTLPVGASHQSLSILGSGSRDDIQQMQKRRPKQDLVVPQAITGQRLSITSRHHQKVVPRLRRALYSLQFANMSKKKSAQFILQMLVSHHTGNPSLDGAPMSPIAQSPNVGTTNSSQAAPIGVPTLSPASSGLNLLSPLPPLSISTSSSSTVSSLPTGTHSTSVPVTAPGLSISTGAHQSGNMSPGGIINNGVGGPPLSPLVSSHQTIASLLTSLLSSSTSDSERHDKRTSLAAVTAMLSPQVGRVPPTHRSSTSSPTRPFAHGGGGNGSGSNGHSPSTSLVPPSGASAATSVSSPSGSPTTPGSTNNNSGGSRKRFLTMLRAAMSPNTPSTTVTTATPSSNDVRPNLSRATSNGASSIAPSSATSSTIVSSTSTSTDVTSSAQSTTTTNAPSSTKRLTLSRSVPSLGNTPPTNTRTFGPSIDVSALSAAIMKGNALGSPRSSVPSSAAVSPSPASSGNTSPTHHHHSNSYGRSSERRHVLNKQKSLSPPSATVVAATIPESSSSTSTSTSTMSGTVVAPVPPSTEDSSIPIHEPTIIEEEKTIDDPEPLSSSNAAVVSGIMEEEKVEEKQPWQLALEAVEADSGPIDYFTAATAPSFQRQPSSFLSNVYEVNVKTTNTMMGSAPVVRRRRVPVNPLATPPSATTTKPRNGSNGRTGGRAGSKPRTPPAVILPRVATATSTSATTGFSSPSSTTTPTTLPALTPPTVTNSSTSNSGGSRTPRTARMVPRAAMVMASPALSSSPSSIIATPPHQRGSVTDCSHVRRPHPPLHAATTATSHNATVTLSPSVMMASAPVAQRPVFSWHKKTPSGNIPTTNGGMNGLLDLRGPAVASADALNGWRDTPSST
jgi:hypothetical protein